MECFISRSPTQQLNLTSDVLKGYLAAVSAASGQGPMAKESISRADGREHPCGVSCLGRRVPWHTDETRWGLPSSQRQNVLVAITLNDSTFRRRSTGWARIHHGHVRAREGAGTGPGFLEREARS